MDLNSQSDLTLKRANRILLLSGSTDNLRDLQYSYYQNGLIFSQLSIFGDCLFRFMILREVSK